MEEESRIRHNVQIGIAMKNKRFLVMLCCIFAYLLLNGIVAAQLLFPPREFPQAVGGSLDAIAWDFQNRGAIPLRGEWEFYDGRLLGPDDFRNDPALAAGRELVRVPGNWNGFVAGGRSYGYGAGTYRLTVRLAQPEVYSLRAKKIRLSSRIYLNGVDKGGSGTPALTGSGFVASNLPFLGTEKLETGSVDIIIQVANFVYSNGGLVQTPEFGFASDVADNRDKSRMIDMVLITVMLTFGLYFAGMFRQWRQERYLMHLSLFCLFTGLYFTIDNEIVAVMLFPAFPFEWLQKMLYLWSILASFFFSLYVYRCIGEEERAAHRWLRRILYVYMALIVLVPNSVLSYGLLPSMFMQTAIFLQIVYALISSRSKGTPGTSYVVLGVLFMIINIVVCQYRYLFAIEAPVYVAVTPLLLVFSQALLMSLRLQQAFLEKERLSRQLIAYDRLKDEFLAKTSHELRTPLHGIVNLSQTMLDDVSTALDPKHRENVWLLNSVGRRLAGLVHDILDMSQIRQGRLHMNMTAVDVRMTVRFVMDMLLVFHTNKRVVVTCELGEDVPLVRADENRLRQVLHNLLENALKFTDRGTVRIFADRRGDRLAISVSDTGRGIPAGQRERIFRPYEQHGTDDGPRVGGIGLGLSITKQLIELQGGELELKSEEGEGSCFTFTLQIAGGGQAASASTALQAQTDVAGISMAISLESGKRGEATVLLVDDELSNLKVLIDIVSSMNFAYRAVHSGEEALAKLKHAPLPDIVLLDVMMPHMSGIEVCREIRVLHGVAELPVLMLTASGQIGDMVASFQAGANDILQKPFEPAELKARMQSLLYMKQSVERASRKELDYLQAQITPHFLYNSLNAIMGLSYKDIDKLRETLLNLTTYLRAKFTFTFDDQSILLERELELVQAYAAIEQLRFGSRLRVCLHVDETHTFLLPPLTIQPLVENAIRHGIGPKLAGGTVHVTVRRANGCIQISVEDDGAGMTPDTLSMLKSGAGKGVGIGNVNRRLQMLYGRKLEIASEIGKGTIVKFTLPEEPHD
ncbi:ATP-binding protein [Paenibacillus hemerocallicola]|nr:ATP-binding protein [Paenibacillus hemerocallicola]